VESWPIEDDREREDPASRYDFVDGERWDFGEPGGAKVAVSDPLRGLLVVVGEFGDIESTSLPYCSPSAGCFQTND
jgi:hypothetical protein